MLRPEDPTLNDHLGDAYWRVGREREARFQWDQALKLNPEPAEAEKMREKLEKGLPSAQPRPGQARQGGAQRGAGQGQQRGQGQRSVTGSRKSEVGNRKSTHIRTRLPTAMPILASSPAPR